MICGLWFAFAGETGKQHRSLAYVLVAAEGTREGQQVIDDNALPHPLYAGLLRLGAHAVSEAFLQLYLRQLFSRPEDQPRRVGEGASEIAQEPP
jgi:hypothetical protein